MKRRFLSLFTLLCVITGIIVSISVLAYASETCGENVMWTIADGVQ